MAKSVAIVGFAQSTCKGIHSSRVDEIWSLNMVLSSDATREKVALPRLDRLFELHQVHFLKNEQYAPNTDHWGWLTSTKHEYPVYMLEDVPEIHNCHALPYDEIYAEFGNGVFRGNEGVDYQTSQLQPVVSA